jgi:uridine kinase
MSKKHIIAIAGNARCGKDTLGKNISNLLNEYGVNSSTYSFADELKKETDKFLIETLGISAYTDNDEEKLIIRPFLVFWGTEIRRKINPSIWVDKVFERIKPNEVAIITDLRFENEFDFIKSNDGLSIYLSRIDSNGNQIGPANDYEKTNNEFLSQNADSNFTWVSSDDLSLLKSLSNEALETILTEERFEAWKAISL